MRSRAQILDHLLRYKVSGLRPKAWRLAFETGSLPPVHQAMWRHQAIGDIGISAQNGWRYGKDRLNLSR